MAKSIRMDSSDSDYRLKPRQSLHGSQNMKVQVKMYIEAQNNK